MDQDRYLLRPQFMTCIIYFIFVWSALVDGKCLELTNIPTSSSKSCPKIRFHSEKRNISTIYIRRMRKAASTTIFKGVQDFYHQLDVQGNEQYRINKVCLSPPFSNSILFLTHLREPLSRIKSEFYYVGPGGKHADYQENNEIVWSNWIKQSHDLLYKVGGNHSGLIHGGTLIDNLYTRALTGNCDSKCVVKPNGHVNGCILCGRHGKEPRLLSLSEKDINDANMSLEKFDIVIIIELLNNEDYLNLIRNQMAKIISPSSSSVRLSPSLTFKHARFDNKAHTIESDIPSSISLLLVDENKYDLTLYSIWKSMAQCQLESFQMADCRL